MKTSVSVLESCVAVKRCLPAIYVTSHGCCPVNDSSTSLVSLSFSCLFLRNRSSITLFACSRCALHEMGLTSSGGKVGVNLKGFALVSPAYLVSIEANDFQFSGETV